MNKKDERCDFCEGKLAQGKKTLEFWRGEELIVIRNVPAYVCQQCGEGYFSAEVSKKLDLFIEQDFRCEPENYITVPQYSAEQVLGD